MLITYNKLIRDRIPAIERDGCRAALKELDDIDFKRELLAKLV